MAETRAKLWMAVATLADQREHGVMWGCYLTPSKGVAVGLLVAEMKLRDVKTPITSIDAYPIEDSKIRAAAAALAQRDG